MRKSKKQNKVSKIELALAMMVVAKESIKDLLNRGNTVKKQIINGEVVTVVDVEYKVVM